MSVVFTNFNLQYDSFAHKRPTDPGVCANKCSLLTFDTAIHNGIHGKVQRPAAGLTEFETNNSTQLSHLFILCQLLHRLRSTIFQHIVCSSTGASAAFIFTFNISL